MSRIFEKGNWSNDQICPICNTNDDKPVTLIGIVGTQEDNIIEAEQIHVDCVLKDLFLYKEKNLIAKQF